MGFLKVGTALMWNESLHILDYIKLHGLYQFLHVWRVNKNRQDKIVFWGDEVEFGLLCIQNEKSSIYLNADRLITMLEDSERNRTFPLKDAVKSEWHPEFSNYVIESIPSPPYPFDLDSIDTVEDNIRTRRLKIQSVLDSNQFVASLTVFPRFGLKDSYSIPRDSYNSVSTVPDPDHSVSRSIFLPDCIMSSHPRFSTLVNNIRCRRKVKPCIMIPLYKDVNTDGGRHESRTVSTEQENDWSLSHSLDELDWYSIAELSKKTFNPVKDCVYMDAFGFGMGNCCIQTTHMCESISHARFLYDQLLVLAPLLLAMTAATPMFRGLLTATDTRWSSLEQAVDCRTEEEMNFIQKSRYSPASLYIADCEPLVSHVDILNNTFPFVNTHAKDFLVKEGVDDILAQHFALLWVRDPMVIFKENIYVDDTRSMDHFENLQSTSWNSVRFKPPPPSIDDPNALSPIGWRVECRTPDIQLTDVENAVFISFISIFIKVIQAKNLEMYIPMHMNDENIARAHHENAATRERFYFRCGSRTSDNRQQVNFSEVKQWSLVDILRGVPDEPSCPGLIPLCREYLSEQLHANNCRENTLRRFNEYSDFILARVSGKLMTDARYLRYFVMQHPSYKRDSVIPPVVAHDISVLSVYLGFGLCKPIELFGHLFDEKLNPFNAYLDTLKLPRFSAVLLQDARIRQWLTTTLRLASHYTYLLSP